MQGGLILTPPKFSDYSRERIFGAPQGTLDIVPLNRDISGLPVVYQGSENTCVSCAFTFIRQYQEKGNDLSHESLAVFSNTSTKGATVRQVGDAARKVGITDQETWNAKNTLTAMAVQEAAAKNKISNYFTLEDVSANGIYHALKQGLVAIGVKNFKGVGPHFLVAFDVTPDGLALKCANWWKEDVQDVVEVDFADVVTAVTLESMPQYASASGAQMPKFLVFWKNVLFHKAKIFGAALLSLVSGSAMQFGAGYTPVTDYSSNTTQYISATAATIPVASTKDKAGNEIVMASIGGTAYFTLEPGTTREEITACTSKSVGQWSNCLRGLPFQGGSLTPSTTLQYAHNAGSRIVMSDVGQFFTEFVSVSGTQTIYDQKTFNTIPAVTSTTAIPSADNFLATKYYVDTVGAGGFTAANIGAGYGLKALGTVPEKVAIDISATSSGLMFGGIAANQLQIQTSSTGGIAINGIGSLYLDTSDSFTWTGSNTISAGLGHLYVPTPTDVAEATPKNYVDAADLGNTATGTAGVTIAAGQVLYISSTNTLFLADADVTTTTYPFVGIALTGASAGNQVTYARQDGIATGLSGLTAGSTYYISGTAGSLTTTPGTVPARVLRALTTTSGIVLQPTFTATASGTAQVLYDGTVVAVTTGFVPTKVNLLCEAGSGSNSTGSWWRNSNGTNGQFSRGADTNALPYERHSANLACTQRTVGGIFSISVATSTDGFTLTPSNPGGAVTYPVYWEAEYFSE